MAPDTAGGRSAFDDTDAGDAPTLGRLARVPGYLLRRAAALSHSRLADAAAARGLELTPVQCGMLLLIDDNPGLSQNDMARLMMVEGATLIQALTRLRGQGLVQRYRMPSDRRVFALHLTRPGKRALAEVRAAIDEQQAALFACLSDAEREQLVAMLQRVIAHGARGTAAAGD